MTTQGGRQGASGGRQDDGDRGDPTVARVAILGGGMGGLTAAAFLQGMQDRDRKVTFACDLFEASGRIGGNMHSAYFSEAYSSRFADMGVNDFNANTYHHMMALIGTLEAAGYPVPLGKLLDTETYFVPAMPGRSPRAFTSEEVAQPGGNPFLQRLHDDWARFESLAPEVMTDDAYATMSVSDFVAKNGFSDDFRDNMLLPRVNAMYFMTEGDPGRLPIRGIMYYYHLQEGLGSPDPHPDRRFFREGASQWARQLERYVRDRGCRVRLHAAPRVTPEGDRLRVSWTVQTPEGPLLMEETYDHVVCAVPPHRIADVLPTLAEDWPELAQHLPGFGCYLATAYVHDDARVMPADRAKWRTYNVLIEGKDETVPYTMSYVNAMHNGVDLPVRPFITENPIVPIPDALVRHMVDLSDPALARMVPAKADFTHNTVSAETMAVQPRIPQGRKHVYFTGGWTNGAGLQEQIIVASVQVALRIRNYGVMPEDLPHDASRPGHVPAYLRRTLGHERGPLRYPEGFWPSA